jgi:Domain of unknown function (DUF932)
VVQRNLAFLASSVIPRPPVINLELHLSAAMKSGTYTADLMTFAGDRLLMTQSLLRPRETDAGPVIEIVFPADLLEPDNYYTGLTAGLRVFVCSNMAFSGDFTPVLAKHTKSFNLVDTLSVGVDRIHRNFEPMQRQVESWRQTQITDAEAKLIFYSAFVDGKLDAPKSLLPDVHRLYFEPEYPEFSQRTMWSLSNAFTSAFKKLDPVPQFKATAKLGEFLAQLPA